MELDLCQSRAYFPVQVLFMFRTQPLSAGSAASLQKPLLHSSGCQPPGGSCIPDPGGTG